MAKAKKQTTQHTFGASKAATTVAPKANNVTASTATKNVSSTPAVAPKANNVTAATATKNVSPSAPVTAKYTAPSTPTYTAPSTPTYTAPSTPSAPVSENKYNPSTPTKNDAGAYAMTHDNIVTPTTSTGEDAFPSLAESLLGGTTGLTGASVTGLAQTINPNTTPAEKTDYWNGVLNDILDTSGLTANTATYGLRNLIRNNAEETALEDEEENLGKYNRVNGIVDQVAPPYSSPNYGLADAISKNTSPSDAISSTSLGKGRDPELANADLNLDLLADAVSKTIGGGGTSGGSGSRGGSGGGSVASGIAGGYDLSSLEDLINRQLAEYDNGYNTLMQNLLNAYNANFGSLNDSYLAALQALGLNYADTENLLNGRLANSQQALEDARKRAMQEAYISRMMDQKNLEDYLGAAGLSGGATESVLSGILNNYRNNRNKIEENTQTSLRELLQTYLDNMSNARQAYNSGLLNAENNRMSAAQNLANGLYESQANAASNYANQRANVYSNLYDTLAKLALKG